MKNNGATNRFRISIAVAIIMFCGAAISLFLMESVMSASNTEKPRIEKQGRLTIFNFDVKAASIAKPVQVRAVVSRETKFRVSASIAKDFPRLDTTQIEVNKVLWTKESELPEKEYLPDSWVGLFLAFDGDLGYIQNRLRSYRIYRKYLNEFEIDYVFSSEFMARNELTKQIYEIDKQVFEILKNSGAFHK